jgi:hypothetical protein
VNKGLLPIAQAAELMWLNIPLINSWAHYDLTGLGPAQWAKDQFGFVYMRGLIKSGTISSSVPFAILPAEFRPPVPYTLLFIADSNGAYGAVRIRGLDGYCLPYAGNNAYVSLTSIIFSTVP